MAALVLVAEHAEEGVVRLEEAARRLGAHGRAGAPPRRADSSGGTRSAPAGTRPGAGPRACRRPRPAACAARVPSSKREAGEEPAREDELARHLQLDVAQRPAVGAVALLVDEVDGDRAPVADDVVEQEARHDVALGCRRAGRDRPPRSAQDELDHALVRLVPPTARDSSRSRMRWVVSLFVSSCPPIWCRMGWLKATLPKTPVGPGSWKPSRRRVARDRADGRRSGPRRPGRR